MKFVKEALGWIVAFGLFVTVKLAGCTSAQRAEVKNAASDIIQCAQPAAEEGTQLYEQCVQNGGDTKWCATHAILPTIQFVECLWQKHLAGQCDPANCPFHPATADGGSYDAGGI